MSILNIRKAVRSGSKLVIGVAGQSGSGKTLTALYMARGMVDSSEQVGFLDTENRRGSLYADELDGSFMIGDLFYPFSPARYAEAVKEFQAAGVKVLVVDSISHEWESGCMEIAEAPLLNGKKMADWKKAKSEHKKLMTVLLQSDMHIICCIRAAEKTDFTNPREPKSLGVQPLCEKNFMFEMTASVMMYAEGSQQQHLKIPKDLKPVFGNGNGYLGIETGKKIREWAEGGGGNEELNSFRNLMQLASNDGTEALKAAWIKMPADIKTKMEQFKRQVWSCAVAIDEQNKAVEPEVEEVMDDFTPGKIMQKEKAEAVVDKIAAPIDDTIVEDGLDANDFDPANF
tara:strand:- start:1501 stop:2529 length:1029 start_codon:yes stop_codon:yes gene_type:complete